MSAHDECRGVGKFDCDADELIYDLTMDDGAGEGDVESPSGWWETVDLTEPADEALAEHYGARYLIAREGNDGRFWVEAYATREARNERLDVFEEAYRAWYSDADAGEEPSWDPR